jgi:sphingosine kinase
MKISTSANDLQSHNGHYHHKEESIDTNVILRTDTFDLNRPKGLIPCTLQLKPTVLSYQYKTKSSKEKKKIIYVEDIIGCSIDEVKESSQNAFLNIIAYRIRKSERKKKLVEFVICKHSTYEENFSEALNWKNSILSLNYGESDKSKPLLFIVNPFSGKGRALKLFEHCVKPLLIESEINFELKITQYANHAFELMRDMDEITRYHGVVVVSGDGLLYEVVNGLTERTDTLTSNRVPIALGIIPGGSGNGLAHAINQAFLYGIKSVDPIFDCTLHVTRGRPKPMDLIRVTTLKQTYYSFLSVGWGLMADIDIESERLRMIGEPRFTVWALLRSFALRKYSAKLSYLPAEGNSSTSISPLSSSVPSDWITIEDNFIQIYSAYQTHISSSVIFAPNAKLDDGIIWLLFIRGNVSRKQVVQFLLALEKGKHTSLPYLTFLPVKAFRIEPTNNVGRLTIDGELVECGPAQAEVIPRMATVLSR